MRYIIVKKSNLWRCGPQLQDQLKRSEAAYANSVAVGRSAEDLECLAGQVKGIRNLLERAIVESATRKRRRGTDV